RIVHACERVGRDPATVRLIAVTKGVAVARIADAISDGVTDIGENRVQEAERKQQALDAPVRWHMLGHIQTNKARRAAELFDVVHSVDGERLLRALDAGRPDQRGPLEVLVEVELTGIAARTGAPEAGVAALVLAASALPHVRLRGLMTIAAPGPTADAARPLFTRLRLLRDALQQREGVPLPELSMGMSDDF